LLGLALSSYSTTPRPWAPVPRQLRRAGAASAIVSRAPANPRLAPAKRQDILAEQGEAGSIVGLARRKRRHRVIAGFERSASSPRKPSSSVSGRSSSRAKDRRAMPRFALLLRRLAASSSGNRRAAQ